MDKILGERSLRKDALFCFRETDGYKFFSGDFGGQGCVCNLARSIESAGTVSMSNNPEANKLH